MTSQSMNKKEPVAMSEDFPLSVTLNEDDSFTIEWDPDHPVTSFFNDWTEEDFEQMIANHCRLIIEQHDLDTDG